MAFRLRRYNSIVLGCVAVIGLLQIEAGGQQLPTASTIHQSKPEFPPALVHFRQAPATPVFTAGKKTDWDAAIRERGWILKDGLTWKMWYTGYDGEPESLKKLGYATSTDGVHWQRHKNNPLIDDVWIEDMMVVRDGDRYLMFAEGKNDQAQLLSSTDGLKWVRLGTLDIRLTNGKPIPPGPFGTPTAFRHQDGTWYLYYERRDAGVWLATSKTLLNWKNVSDEPVIKLGRKSEWDGLMIALNQIIKHDGRYYASYHGTNTPTKPRAWVCGLAVSDDLVHWKKYAGNPVTVQEKNQSSGIFVKEKQGYTFFTMHNQVERYVPVK